MINAADPIIAEFDAVAEEAQTLAFLPRALELQAAMRARVEEFLTKLAGRKAAFVKAADEEAANALLAMELSLRTVKEELEMWIALRADSPEVAWDHLVTAQNLCGSAIDVRKQIGVPCHRLENLQNKYLAIEHLIFPPQIFCSVGGKAMQRKCSICGGDYEECGHIKGRAYWGDICYVTLTLGELREVSLVTDPADKRCRLTHFSEGEKRRNKMTWRLEDGPGPPDFTTETNGE